METFRLRDYLPDDFPALIRLFMASVTQVASRDYSASQIHAWAQTDEHRWRSCLDNALLVAVCEGKQIAGFITLEQNGHLDLLFVHPDYLRRGVASALLAHADLTAREQGVKRLYTEASITARPFFLRYGFRVVSPQVVTVRGEDFTRFAMEKWLE